MREIIGYTAKADAIMEQIEDAESTFRVKGHSEFVDTCFAEVRHACVSVFDNSRCA